LNFQKSSDFPSKKIFTVSDTLEANASAPSSLPTHKHHSQLTFLIEKKQKEAGKL
jgi:hypothetical protein